MPTIESVECFKTADGRVFMNKADAIAHANAEKYQASIDEFLASREWPQGQATQAARHIGMYLAFQDTKRLPELKSAA